jgi:hypothetical protein
MYIRMSVAFLLIMLLGSPIVLLPSQVFALPWCGCGYCYMQATGKCTCGPPFHWCLDDFNPSQDIASTDSSPADSSSIPEGLTSTVAKADVTERVMDLMRGGKCFRDRVALSLLGSARESLKYVPVRFDEKNMLAFLIDADKEK